MSARKWAFLLLMAAWLVSGVFAAQGTAPLPDAAAAAPSLPGFAGTERLSTAVEIALLLTALSLLPAVLVTVTSFTRIVIVLSFVRRALSVNELPPNPVLIGLALFLTMFVMAPVATSVHAKAWVPYQAGEMGAKEAMDTTWAEFSVFLVNNTRPSELELFQEMANGTHSGIVHAASSLPVALDADGMVAETDAKSLPARVVIPAFVLSELKTAFQMGFLLFLPFLVIDLVVSSVLLSMGMFMLPPVMISTPIKILVFVLVDGWHLICESVVTSFL
ncbi:MAG: flagellar type III secretion system pore protein FliP [Planctomycetes bacterium]|nr:flagellar type III secretion system pore protein FliP [Planctomycetota bacterium]MCB9909958.1 flagellar type III secretion system pore protein FliP [Planctomycetota bacterium]MCB9912905.1 flagellar type III secretion system pore protein FliP [Planctomycetota bacterium]HRV81799.1 flagellar type III secretion system pore protein FliP [Planctomycetota bacterium]